MKTNDARRAVKAALLDSGGEPQAPGLIDAFEALDREVRDGTPPTLQSLLDFDVSFMDDYFENPFVEARSFADAIYAAAGRQSGVVMPVVPTLDHMTAYYTLYLVDRC